MRIADKYGISPATLAIGTSSSYIVLFMFLYYILICGCVQIDVPQLNFRSETNNRQNHQNNFS